MADKIIDININPNSPKLLLKQDKEDPNLKTEDKTVVGAINENTENLAQKQDILKNGTWVSILNDTVDIYDKQLVRLGANILTQHQWTGLKTNYKNVLGAINEITKPWITDGVFINKQLQNFVPISGHYYRVSYNFDYKSVVYRHKIFRWSGHSTDTPSILDQQVIISPTKAMTIYSLTVTPDSIKILANDTPPPAGMGEIFLIEKCIWNDF